MRTNVVLDDDLVHEAMRLGGVKTKKEIIAIALQEFVTSRKRKNILELAGRIKFMDDYDYKELRKNI